MQTAEVEKILTAAGDLPTMPVVAMKVMTLLNNPDFSTKELARIISSDLGITAKILKIANSAFYGCSREIASVDRAVVLLGARTMKSLVVAASTKGVYKDSGLVEQKMWEHGVGVAIGAHILASELRVTLHEEALVCGLLHDIGKVILKHHFPEKFEQLYEAMYNQGSTFEDLEMQIFGFSHTEVATVVARHWKLSQSVECVLGFQREPQKIPQEQAPYRPLAACVNLANDIALYKGIGERQPRTDINPAACPGAAVLGLQPERVAALVEKITERYAEEKAFFD